MSRFFVSNNMFELSCNLCKAYLGIWVGRDIPEPFECSECHTELIGRNYIYYLNVAAVFPEREGVT